MRPFKSLKRRIIVAYLLFAVVASVFFAMIAAIAVEGIEVRLVDARLKEVAAWASPRHAAGLPVEMPAGLSFHHAEDTPLPLRGLAPGMHEKTVDGVDLHVLVGSDVHGAFVVIDHATEYEKIELVVYSMFALGFIGFLICASLLGAFIANRLITPIMSLTQAVKVGQTALPLQDSADELGILARAFAARTAELTEVLDRERFFTGDVSHELRTPLTVITGAAEILMEQGADAPLVRSASERIYRAAREATDSVTVLLRLARAPELLECASLSVAELARQECLRFQSHTAGKPLSLVFAGGEDFLVNAPRELLAAAIGNLVRNACQYTLQGEVIVRLAGCALIVEDTGPGLPEAARARLLHQPIPANLGGSSGTGLGLGLVQRICLYLGADLAFSVRPAGGSVLRIDFI
ncbi:two-component sensor histidine kinase [Janthinobacterium sp. FT14W]|uniref:sensor histidine kinase n=1 Tax=Janthinobacterium sp. FT14W TaxID=2654253 RepID=UPI001264F8D5|nr:sensor histidine kinase [Janthinobacterium sp. FT14W]KAB8049180.1 two-component sensor histidine kinase [Janthinobacterium sp. FT14W]